MENIVSKFELAMQQAVVFALGLDPTKEASFAMVRVGWQTTGQPAWKIDEDIVVVRGLPIEEPDVDGTPDVTYQNGGLTKAITYMRVWQCQFTFYGPSAISLAQSIQTKFLTDFDLHGMLAQKNYYLVPELPAPTRNGEMFEGQWWERCDMAYRFNEFVVETTESVPVSSAEVILIKENGLTADVTAESK